MGYCALTLAKTTNPNDHESTFRDGNIQPAALHNLGSYDTARAGLSRVIRVAKRPLVEKMEVVLDVKISLASNHNSHVYYDYKAALDVADQIIEHCQADTGEG